MSCREFIAGFGSAAAWPLVAGAQQQPLPVIGISLYSVVEHDTGVSLPRYGSRVGLRIGLFEACSAFTRVTACTLARSPSHDMHSEGFSYFVTSIAAPVASGWSDEKDARLPGLL
jgi:hypothetical protein